MTRPDALWRRRCRLQQGKPFARLKCSQQSRAVAREIADPVFDERWLWTMRVEGDLYDVEWTHHPPLLPLTWIRDVAERHRAKLTHRTHPDRRRILPHARDADARAHRGDRQDDERRL